MKTYITYLFTFLIIPVLGLRLSRYREFDGIKKYLLWPLLLSVVHNVLFFNGVSIKGDYPDFCFFSLEYLFFCYVVFLLYGKRARHLVVLRIIGTAVVVTGFIQGLLGILLFIVVAQDFETDKIFTFVTDEKMYQTRCYSFGFVTQMDMRYTLRTFMEYRFIPFEKRIDETRLSELNDGAAFDRGRFRVNLAEDSGNRKLEFTATNGRLFTKILK